MAVSINGISASEPSNITIDNRDSIADHVDLYDIIYLKSGLYDDINQRQINITKDTKIAGEIKESTILNIENTTQVFYIFPGKRLWLDSLTITGGGKNGTIVNDGELFITNCVSINNGKIQKDIYPNSYASILINKGNLTINDSNFISNYGNNIFSIGNNLNIELNNCSSFNHLKTGTFALFDIEGDNNNIKINNFYAENSSTYRCLIYLYLNNSNVSITNCVFTNANVKVFEIILKSIIYNDSHSSHSEGLPNNVYLYNNTAYNNTLVFDSDIDIKVTEQKNNVFLIKADLYGEHSHLSGEMLNFYIDGKFVKSVVVNSAGVASIHFSPKTYKRFTVKVIFNGFTENFNGPHYNVNAVNSTYIYKSAKYNVSFLPHQHDINYRLDKSLIQPVRFGGYKVKYYNFRNTGKSIGSKVFTVKISSKYKLYAKKGATVKYNKKTKKWTVNVSNLIPFSVKKTQAIIALVRVKK